jgi:hypothetical protein
VRLWNTVTGEALARLLSFRDGTWAVVDALGRFDAANGGDIEGLHWVLGSEQISLSQLKERYYDPGLLAKSLMFNRDPLRPVQKFSAPKLYPLVEIGDLDAGEPLLRLNLSNRGGGIGRVVVLIVEVSPLFQYAADEVPVLASNIGGIQRPQIAAPRGASFPIGLLRRDDRQAIPLAQSKPQITRPFLLNPDKKRDDLQLSGRLRDHLREQSLASIHGTAGAPPGVFIDAEYLPGAIQPSGVYSVREDRVSVTLVLVRDDRELTEFEIEGDLADIPALTNGIADEIWRLVPKLDR